MNKFSIKDHMSKNLEDKASEALAKELDRIESGGLGDAPVTEGKIDRAKMSDAENSALQYMTLEIRRDWALRATPTGVRHLIRSYTER